MQIYRSPNLAGLSTITHGFFGRAGGVSDGIYASLNCGPGSRDDPAAIAQNRARLVAALAPGGRLLTLAQIHSPIVHLAGPDWDAARQPPGDALVTATPGLMLGIQTADCAPVLLADAQAGVIGAAHAGWKGALAGVLEATVAAMTELGAAPARIAAAIGPTISQANYEVDARFRHRLLEADPANSDFFVAGDRNDHFHFDLEAYVAARLTGAGVVSPARLGLCTYPAQNGFFSFRRATHRGEPDYGREISAIVLTA